MSLAILGIGTALPPTVVSQQDASGINRQLCCRTEEQKTWLPAMYEGSGINTRRLCLGKEVLRDILDGTRHTNSPFLPSGREDDRGPSTRVRMEHYAALAPPLAVEAAQMGMRRSGLAAAAITHLVTVSCTGFMAPGIDVAILNGLSLRPTVERTHVGFMGCHGAINGLRIANAFAGSTPNAHVLLVAVELCTLHYHYTWDPQKMIANALFADGAAAVVGSPAAAARHGAWRVAATGSCLVPNSTDAMTWTVGDHGFEMTLAKRVPTLIANHLRPWLESWLSEHVLRLGDIASWALHPGGPRILSAVEEGLNLRPEDLAASRAVFGECGNMSSPTLLFILDHLQASGAKRPCVALGFGPGLVAEAALFL